MYIIVFWQAGRWDVYFYKRTQPLLLTPSLTYHKTKLFKGLGALR